MGPMVAQNSQALILVIAVWMLPQISPTNSALILLMV